MSPHKLVKPGEKKTPLKDLSHSNHIPPSVKENVLKVLDAGSLYRYDVADGKTSEVSLLEKEFAYYVKAKYAIAVSSCSAAMYMALKCANVQPNDKVLMPAFTFTAVPSAIVHANAIPVLVEITEDYVIDIDDLRKKIHPDTKVLLLSHMRGHVGDMDKIVEICKENNVFLIEDAAHSLGVLWNGKQTGTIGKVGCYSLQDYKIIKSGEGGMFVTDDDVVAAKAIIYAGSYETYWRTHLLKPQIMEEYQKTIPTFNFRMSNITAAIVRPQLAFIDERIKQHNQIYSNLVHILSKSKYIKLPKHDSRVSKVFDSIQFRLLGFKTQEIELFETLCNQEGLPIQLLGGKKFNARCFWNWHYFKNTHDCPSTREILNSSFDMRLHLSMKKEDIENVGNTVTGIIDHICAQNK